MEFDFVPTEGYLAHKEDYDLGRFETTFPYAVNENCMRHMGYKVVEPSTLR